MWQACKLYLDVFTVLEDHIPGGDMSVLLSPTQQAYTSCICRPRTVVTVFRRSPVTASLYLVKSEAFIWVLEINILWLWVPFLPLLGGKGFLLASGCIRKDVWIIVALREDAVLGTSASLPPSETSVWEGTQPFTQWKHSCLPVSSWHRCTEFSHTSHAFGGSKPWHSGLGSSHTRWAVDTLEQGFN